MKKLFILNAGSWGERTAEDYTQQAQTIAHALELTGAVKEGDLKIEIVSDLERVLSRLHDEDVLVFLSRAWIPRAREVKQKHPKVRVVVITGLIPQEEVIILSSSWLGGVEALEKHLLHGAQGL